MYSKNTIRVYFAEQARFADIDRSDYTERYVSRLKRDGDTYLASTRADYLALRPYEWSEPHTVSEG